MSKHELLGMKGKSSVIKYSRMNSTVVLHTAFHSLQGCKPKEVTLKCEPSTLMQRSLL